MSPQVTSLLSWLRERLDERGLKTASLAARMGAPRSHVRRVLSGGEDLTVEELLRIIDILELSPEELGLPALEVDDKTPMPEVRPMQMALADDEEDVLELTPWGNHHEQLLRVAFELGCDVGFTCATPLLADSGIPAAVLQAQGPQMLIQLDAAYHRYNNPRYDEGGVTLTLSFDALYDCRFPWEAVGEVIFRPQAFDPPAETDDVPPSGPHLRLVT